MKIHGYTLTDEQISAGLAAMTGVFDAHDIESRLLYFGVPFRGKSGSITKPDEYLAYRAADRLLQRERKAGRIKHIGGGKWERV